MNELSKKAVIVTAITEIYGVDGGTIAGRAEDIVADVLRQMQV